ncbi:MAG: phosphatase PAP2 family protein [Candidatus Rokubacteria bacterium]|nr:phosphatase PAP2 family protein [Candidatus Rokubacteria bacterium]
MSAGVFLALALLVYIAGQLPGEQDLYQAIVDRASPGIVAVFQWVNQLGNKWVLAPAALVLLLVLRPAHRRWWLWISVLVGAPVLEDLVKPVVGRLRPEGGSLGFPSGHVTAAAAFFFLAAYLGGKAATNRPMRIGLWLAAAVLVGLVGLARIVLRAHWPGDAVGGAALGLACVALAAWWHERHAYPVSTQQE